MDKRKKAWIGAAISAAAGIAGSIIDHNQQRKEAARARAQAVKEAAFQQAGNIQQQYVNDSMIDAYNNKIVFKNGGRAKLPKTNDSRLSQARYGMKHKARCK